MSASAVDNVASAGRATALASPRFVAGLVASNAGPALAVVLFWVITIVTTYLAGHEFKSTMTVSLVQLYSVMVPIFLGIVLVWAFVRMAIIERPDRPIHHFATVLRRFAFDPTRLCNAAIKSVLIVVFMANFSVMKDLIPTLNPFSWDRAFQHLDRLLFFGTDPWKLTFAVFGTPLGTTVVNAFYHAWLFVIYFFLLVAVFGLIRQKLQQTFLYAFMITWVGGGVILATIFSSVGPVYFARLGLGADFEPQMELLRQFNEVSPVWALNVQDLLWLSYTGSDTGFSGITAMPSMHVASSVVVMLAAYGINRWLGHAMAFFTAAIFIGSVHLAWHYAADGILAVAVAAAAWWLGARLADADLAWQRRFARR